MKKIFLMIVLVFSFVSCKTIHDVEYITKTEYKDRIKVERDTTYVQDSIYIHEKADTVYVEKWHNKYIEHIKTDSVYICMTDTVKVDNIVYKDKEIGFFDKMHYYVVGILWGLVLGAIALLILYFK